MVAGIDPLYTEAGQRCKARSEGLTRADAQFHSACQPSILDSGYCSVVAVAESCGEREAGSMCHRQLLKPDRSIKPLKPQRPVFLIPYTPSRVGSNKTLSEGRTGAIAPFQSECHPSIVDSAYCSGVAVAPSCRERDASSMWYRRLFKPGRSIKPLKLERPLPTGDGMSLPH